MPKSHFPLPKDQDCPDFPRLAGRAQEAENRATWGREGKRQDFQALPVDALGGV
jgi:hypothetical protein